MYGGRGASGCSSEELDAQPPPGLATVAEDREGVYNGGGPQYRSRYGSRKDQPGPELEQRQEYEPPSERRTSVRRPASASLGVQNATQRPTSAPRERPTSAPLMTKPADAPPHPKRAPPGAYHHPTAAWGRPGAADADPYTSYAYPGPTAVPAFKTAPATVGSKRRMHNVHALMHREKEFLAEEVFALSARTNKLEDLNRKTQAENRRLHAEKQRAEALLRERECAPMGRASTARGLGAKAGGDGAPSSLEQKLKERIRELKGINTELEAELVMLNELEAENEAFLHEVTRLTTLLQRRRPEASAAAVEPQWDSDGDTPCSRPTSAALERPGSAGGPLSWSAHFGIAVGVYSPGSGARRKSELELARHMSYALGRLLAYVLMGNSEPSGFVGAAGRGAHGVSTDRNKEERSLRRRLKDMTAAHRAAYTEAVTLRATVVQLEGDLGKMQASVSASRTSTKSKKVQELMDESLALQADIALLKERLLVAEAKAKGAKAEAKATRKGKDPTQMKTLLEKQDRLESQARELTADCERLREERVHLKRAAALEKEAHRTLTEELAQQATELARARAQVRRLQQDRQLPLPVAAPAAAPPPAAAPALATSSPVVVPDHFPAPTAPAVPCTVPAPAPTPAPSSPPLHDQDRLMPLPVAVQAAAPPPAAAPALATSSPVRAPDHFPAPDAPAVLSTVPAPAPTPAPSSPPLPDLIRAAPTLPFPEPVLESPSAIPIPAAVELPPAPAPTPARTSAPSLPLPQSSLEPVLKPEPQPEPQMAPAPKSPTDLKPLPWEEASDACLPWQLSANTTPAGSDSPELTPVKAKAFGAVEATNIDGTQLQASPPPTTHDNNDEVTVGLESSDEGLEPAEARETNPEPADSEPADDLVGVAMDDNDSEAPLEPEGSLMMPPSAASERRWSASSSDEHENDTALGIAVDDEESEGVDVELYVPPSLGAEGGSAPPPIAYDTDNLLDDADLLVDYDDKDGSGSFVGSLPDELDMSDEDF